MLRHIAVGVLCLIWSVVARAQQPANSGAPRRPQEFAVRPATSDVAIDGRLDEAAWKDAVAIPIPYEWFPGDNTPAAAATTCFVTFDDRRLLIAFRAADSDPGAIRANLADRDTATADDTVGFLVDPFNDGRRAFQFRVSARGVQMDAFNSDVTGSEDWSWDAIWDARSVVDESGYTVEIAVPFSSLRFPRTDSAQTWGFLAMRDMPRSTRFRMRSAYSDRNLNCLVCQFDKLTGFQGITPGRNLELDPTVTLARTDLRPAFPDGPLVNGDLEREAGISARWGITPNVVLSGTANPDFYQVEADAAQLDVNTRFQLFFPEKRPFFLEGSDFFATPLTAIFTRTVADPHWGVKLTGKEGPHAFGVFAAQDATTGILIPGYEASSFASLDQHYVSNVFRYRRDMANGSTIGAIYAGREGIDGEPYANRVAGADVLVRLSRSDTLRAQWLASHTDYPNEVARQYDQPAEGFAGQGYSLGYNHAARNWNWSLRSAGVTPEFRADSGFMPQVDLRQYLGNLTYVWIGGPARWFNQFALAASVDRTEDWGGRRASWGCDFPIEYSGRWQMTASYNPACNYEYYLGETYNNFRHNLNWSIRPSRWYSLSASATFGGAVDFANARKADQSRIAASGAFNVLGPLEGSVSYVRQALDVEGGRLFTAHQAQVRVLYHLTLRTFVRAIVQYTDLSRDPALYLAPIGSRSRRAFTQFLFSHKLNPQTVFLVGYSDNGQGTEVVDVTKTDRTFFVKIGYAWVF